MTDTPASHPDAASAGPPAADPAGTPSGPGSTPAPAVPRPAVPSHAHDHDHGHGHDHGAPAGSTGAGAAGAGLITGHAFSTGPSASAGIPGHTSPGASRAAAGAWWRWLIAALIVVLVGLAACLDIVRQGTAVVITRFGDPVRVQLEPGLAWHLPAPIERQVVVDLRLHTTAAGLDDVQTKDSLSVVIQVFAVWRIPADRDHVTLFLRALRNRPDEAGNQLRTFLGSAIQTVTGHYALADLINTNASMIRLGAYESDLAERLRSQMAQTYGMEIDQVGLQRLTLPQETIAATISRMKAERETQAQIRKTEGLTRATEITNSADRDKRILIANASVEAAAIEAKASSEAAAIYGQAHALNPDLYAFLRGLDSLDHLVSNSTRLILRTDAAPYRLLVEGPDAARIAHGGQQAGAATGPAPGSDAAPQSAAASPALRGGP
jgi:membrane protease subunit HflC